MTLLVYLIEHGTEHIGIRNANVFNYISCDVINDDPG